MAWSVSQNAPLGSYRVRADDCCDSSLLAGLEILAEDHSRRSRNIRRNRLRPPTGSLGSGLRARGAVCHHQRHGFRRGSRSEETDKRGERRWPDSSRCHAAALRVPHRERIRPSGFIQHPASSIQHRHPHLRRLHRHPPRKIRRVHRHARALVHRHEPDLHALRRRCGHPELHREGRRGAARARGRDGPRLAAQGRRGHGRTETPRAPRRRCDQAPARVRPAARAGQPTSSSPPPSSSSARPPASRRASRLSSARPTAWTSRGRRASNASPRWTPPSSRRPRRS
jgi:hypothetical protein